MARIEKKKSADGGWILHACRQVFYYEGWLLLITGTLMLLAPQFALEAQGFSAAAVDDPVARGNLQQFGRWPRAGSDWPL